MKKIFACFVLLFIAFPIISENWVGRATTSIRKNGSKTSSGEIYSEDDLTAACNGFKYGAEVKVINLKTKKSITVRINDRVKKRSKYFILLSQKATDELGISNESELVVVEANFSDVNSSEVLSINGLVDEDEIDEETIKNFPDINWPDIDETKTEKKDIDEKLDNKKIDEYPDLEKDDFVPNKKYKKNKMDYDETEGYVYIEKYDKDDPLKDTITDPELKKKTENMDHDDGAIYFSYEKDTDEKIDKIDKLEDPEIDKDSIPDKKYAMYKTDTDYDDIKEDKTEKESPEVDDIKYPDKKDFTNLDYDKDDDIIIIKSTDTPEIDEDKHPDYKDEKYAMIDKDLSYKDDYYTLEKENGVIDKTEIEWQKKLEKNKIYVRFSTTFDKKEGERRMKLFIKVFPNVIGLKKKGRYILLVGPVKEKEIDKTLALIRKYGFKDAYIFKEK